MSDAETILRRQSRMEADRSNFEGLWQEVASLLLPRQADFLGSSSHGAMTQGQRRTEHIFDETALLALDHGVSVFEGEVIPQGGQWQHLQPRDPELAKNHRVRLWYERLTDKLFRLRNSPYSGFANQTHESVASLLSFGGQGMWVDMLRDHAGNGVGLTYRSEHLGELFVEEDHRGVVVRAHRKFHLTHAQAVGKWGAKAPEQAQKGVRDKREHDKGCYIHVLEPNPAFDPRRLDAGGMKVRSCYVSAGDKLVFDEGGYRSMRLTYSRYEKSPTETYGRSPGINVLPAVRACQALQRDLVTATEFMARPALGAHSDMQDEILFYSPGGVSYGAIDERGNKTVQRLWDDVDITPALQLHADTRALIKRAFFEDLYMIRQEVKSHVSATERMLREQQRGVLLAPLKRQESEWFTPMTEVELDLMEQMGMLDDMPGEVVEAGGLYQIVYENPLARARKAEQAGGFYEMLNGVTPLMQAKPELVDEFFRKYPFAKVLDGLGKIHAVPVAWEATDDEMAAEDEARAAQFETESALAIGERASMIAKNLGATQGATGNA